MKLTRFEVKDISFLAIMAALLILVSSVAMPLMTITLYGLRNMSTAFFYAAFSTIALLKVRKPGALTLLAVFNATFLLLMSPVMFINNSVSALLAEIITLLIYGGYQRERAVRLAALLFVPLTLPMTILFGMLINKQNLTDIVQASWLIVPIVIGTFLLSYLGTLVGGKIGTELKKAGKI